jgi:hypothetical protein
VGPRGQQPLVLTCGRRHAYKVFGVIDYFSGRLFYQGQTERFTAQRYCAFLATVLARTDQPLILIQDGRSPAGALGGAVDRPRIKSCRRGR